MTGRPGSVRTRKCGRFGDGMLSWSGPTRASRPVQRFSRTRSSTADFVIVDYIDSHRELMGVEPICAVLTEAGVPIAPPTYYARKATPVTPAMLRQAYLVNALTDVWPDNWGVYGARKHWHAARRVGLDIGRDQVARLMTIGGISGAVRGRHRTRTTERDDRAPRHPGPGAPAAGTGRPSPTSCGWPTSPTCGRWLGSSTSRSSSMSTRGGSRGGGWPPASKPAWSPTPCDRLWTSGNVARPSGQQPD